MKKFIILLFFILIAAGCTSEPNEDNSDNIDTDDDLTQSIIDSEQVVELSDEQAECTAEKLLGKVNDGQLASLANELDSQDVEISAEDKETIEEAFIACADLEQYFVDSYSFLGLEEETSKCLAEELEESDLQEFAALSLSKTAEEVTADLQTKLDVASVKCLSEN